MTVCLFDYGVGNIHSIRKSLEKAGATVVTEEEPRAILNSRVLVLPGVGAFGKVAERLAPIGKDLRDKIEEGLPVLAICIGMHVLYEASEEGAGKGIGVLPGTVRKLDHQRLPHMGWNQLRHSGDGLLEGIPDHANFYYVHSFAPSPCTEHTVATTEYGRPFAAGVRYKNAWGVQFHPEKSSEVGQKLIRNFLTSCLI